MSAAEQQATNIALAQLAASGNSFALGQLWELNKGLLHTLFWKWYPSHKDLADAHGMTADDFEQEGFFAVEYAAKTYDPARGAFYNVAFTGNAPSDFPCYVERASSKFCRL